MSSNLKRSKDVKDVIHHLGPRQPNYQPNHSMYLNGNPSISIASPSNQVLSSSQIVLNPSLINNFIPNSPNSSPQQFFYSETYPAMMGGVVQPQNLIINQPQPQHMIIGQPQPHNIIRGQTQPQNIIMGQPQNVIRMDSQPQNFMIGQNQMVSGLRSSQLHSSRVHTDHVINGERSVEYVPFEKTVVDVVPVAKVETVTVPKVATDYIALERQIEYQPITRFETIKEVVPQMRTEYEERVYEEVVPVSRTEYMPVDRVEERIDYTPVRRQRIISPEELRHSQIYRDEYIPPPPLPHPADRAIHHGTFYSDPLPSHPPLNSYNEHPRPYLPPFDYNEQFIEHPPPPAYADRPQPYPPSYTYNEPFIERTPFPPYNDYPLPPPSPIGYKERKFDRPPSSSLLYRGTRPSPYAEYDHPPPLPNKFNDYSRPSSYWNEFYNEGGEKYGSLPSPHDIVRGAPYLEKDYRPFNDRSYPLFNEFSGPYAKPFDRETFYNDAPYGSFDEKFRDKKERKWKGIDGRF